MAVTQFQSGATATIFPATPDGFDPMTADAATLAFHGIPIRPEHPVRAARWDNIMSLKPRFIEPAFTERETVRNAPQGMVSGPFFSPNWSGAQILFAQPIVSRFADVVGQWVVPNPSSAANKNDSFDSSIWVGVDGLLGKAPGLLQAGVRVNAWNDGDPHNYEYAWWEWVPGGEIEISNLPVRIGETIFCDVSAFTPTTGQIMIINVTERVGVVFPVTAPSGGTLLGMLAEWVVERPVVNGILSTLTDYGFVRFVDCEAFDAADQMFQPQSTDTITMTTTGQPGGRVLSNAFVGPDHSVLCTYAGPLLGPYHLPLLNVASTALPNRPGAVWQMADWDRDGIPDLIMIDLDNTPSGRVEIWIASGKSNFREIILHVQTLFSTGRSGTWQIIDFNGDGIPDLVNIDASSSSGRVEISTLSGASNFNTFTFHRSVFPNETDGVWLMTPQAGGGQPNLVLIKTANAASGAVEVHVATGASDYQTRNFDGVSAFGEETDGVWTMADFDRDGIPDLVFVKLGNTPSGFVEVHVASGASSYASRIFEGVTTFSDKLQGQWLLRDFNRDGNQDLVFVQTGGLPAHAPVSVFISSGAS